jgi:hypothetical protein
MMNSTGDPRLSGHPRSLNKFRPATPFTSRHYKSANRAGEPLAAQLEEILSTRGEELA